MKTAVYLMTLACILVMFQAPVYGQRQITTGKQSESTSEIQKMYQNLYENVTGEKPGSKSQKIAPSRPSGSEEWAHGFGAVPESYGKSPEAFGAASSSFGGVPASFGMVPGASPAQESEKIPPSRSEAATSQTPRSPQGFGLTPEGSQQVPESSGIPAEGFAGTSTSFGSVPEGFGGSAGSPGIPPRVLQRTCNAATESLLSA